eukprot:scaffold9378_cov22-Tisochrysis_lutea.AAC.2
MNLTQLYTKKKKAGWSFNDIMHNAICSEQRWSPFLLTLNAWIPERTQDCAVLVGPCALGEGSALFCLRWHQVQGTSQSSGALVPVLATATLQEMDCNATSSELPIQERSCQVVECGCAALTDDRGKERGARSYSY